MHFDTVLCGYASSRRRPRWATHRRGPESGKIALTCHVSETVTQLFAAYVLDLETSLRTQALPLPSATSPFKTTLPYFFTLFLVELRSSFPFLGRGALVINLRVALVGLYVPLSFLVGVTVDGVRFTLVKRCLL